MARYVTRDGCTLHYEIVGDGPRIALTPGGREPGRMLAPLVTELANHCQVLTWDRRNSGASHVYFEARRTEEEIWADDLAELTGAIGFAPAIIAGGSAGCRASLNTVIRHPSIARALILWSASGGAYGSQFLGYVYHVQYVMAAQGGGMEAVANTPFFAERIAENPVNRERLLSTDPADFIAAMKRWNEPFQYRPGHPVAGVAGDLSSIAVPTLLFEGNDDIHPPEVAEAIAREIPGAQLVPSPWSGQEWMDIFTRRVPGSVFDLYPRLAPQMLAFIRSLEA